MNNKKAVIFFILVLLLAGCNRAEKQISQPPPQPPQIEEEAPGQDNDEEKILEPELPGALLVMVDNYKNARPQSDLDKADIVYEMVAESGITRFMGVFYHRHAQKIGPVRSARYYFVELAKGYDSPLAHAGGSEDSLNLIQRLKLKDLDEIYNAGSYFWRDKARKMPHNLYTSTERLLKGAEDKGYDLVPLPSLPIENDWQGELQAEFTIDYSVSDYEYKVSWNYNGKNYERKINGRSHVMEDGTAITADNVIVISAHIRDVVKNKVLYSEIDIIAKGKARYFIDGKVMEGSWIKEWVSSPLLFLDETGNAMGVKDGQIWVQVIPSFNKLTMD